MSTKSRFNIRLTSLFGRASTGLNGPGWFNASAGGNMRLISSITWQGFGWSVAVAVAASTSRALEERGVVVEKIGTDGSIGGLHVSSDLPIQEEICNIGNSPNSTTRCLTLSFYLCLFFFFFLLLLSISLIFLLIMSCPLSPNV